MMTLQFADTHNLVVFLTKSTESEGFEQIVDFLNGSSIRYALTVNPTIYTSCIEQFWSTVKEKMVNGEVQLQALVDRKKIVVTKAYVRKDLQLKDANGVDCLPNDTIFEQLTLMGYEKLSQKLTFYKAFLSPQWKFLIHTIFQCLSAKTTAWNEFSSTISFAIISQEEIGEGSAMPTDPHHTPIITQPQWKQKSRRPKEKDTKIPQSSARKRVLDLETTKTAQANEIASLKRRVKKLEKKNKSRTHKLKILYKVGLSARVESSEDEESLGEDASKQGRRITDIDDDKDITLVNDQINVDAEMFDVDTLTGDEVLAKQVVAAKDVNLSVDEVTLGQALAALKSAKVLEKGDVIKEPR
ncbi:hypothetical protein Tco_1395989, partial [Tanacetum coccineum]